MPMICDDEWTIVGRSDCCDHDHWPGSTIWIAKGISLLDGVRLRPSSDATQVWSRNGETLISDGPYMESKEHIGGFALIECEHLDAAIESRRGAPFARHGVIELRPVWDGHRDRSNPYCRGVPGELGSDRRDPDWNDRRLGPRRGGRPGRLRRGVGGLSPAGRPRHARRMATSVARNRPTDVLRRRASGAAKLTEVAVNLRGEGDIEPPQPNDIDGAAVSGVQDAGCEPIFRRAATLHCRSTLRLL